MTPDRQIWMAEDVARNLVKRIQMVRNAPVELRPKHLEVARDMLRVLTERIAAL